jgi:cohesin domain-containing protein/PEP-CTERM motif-containing protein
MPRYTYWAGVVLFLALSLAPGTSHAILSPIVTAGDGPVPVLVTVGDTFIIPISYTSVPTVDPDLISWQFDLSFDPTILQANSVTEGPFLSSFGTTLTPPTTFIPGVIDNDTGLISVVADSFNDLPPNPSGSGVLAYIEFTALRVTITPSPLDLKDEFVFLNWDDQGSPPSFLVVDGSVIVGPQVAPVPEPATVSLVSLGLGVLAWKRWRGRGRASGAVRQAHN